MAAVRTVEDARNLLLCGCVRGDLKLVRWAYNTGKAM
jgi:hypothetical protein